MRFSLPRSARSRPLSRHATTKHGEIATTAIPSAVQDTEHTVGALARLNLAAASELAQRVLRARRQALFAAVAMGSLASILAAFACWLVLVAERREGFVRARHERLLQDRATELERFADRVAHDIRGPLTTALLSFDVIARRIDSTGVDHSGAVERGRRALGGVNDIIDALLSFAKAAARPYPEAHADLQDTVSATIDDARGEADRTNVVLRAGPVADLDVACAPGMLRCIVANLVQNAIKYMGDATRREVTVTARRRDDMVGIEVADTGPGIPAELQDTVFDLHVRGVGLGAPPGLGIGLATVKRAVLAHGGSIDVRSTPSTGTSFLVELPIAHVDETHVAVSDPHGVPTT